MSEAKVSSDNTVVIDSYDEMGRVTKQTQTLWGTAYVTAFTYTPGGLVETIKYPSVVGETGRETVTYTYDDAGRPYSLVGTRGSNTWRYVEAAGYNAWGAPEMWDLGDIDDLNRNWLYNDTTRRVSQIRGGTSRLGPGYQVNVMRHRYEGYDLSGNVTVLRDSRNSDQYQCFTYDTMDRLTGAYTASACDGDPDHTGEGWFNHSEFEGGDGYDYDTIGNITDLSGTAYTYAQSGNAGPHAPTGVGSVVFAYDPNGNRLKATDGSDVTTYNYGADNRLEDITLPGGDILEYWYDADGQRVRRRHKGSPNYNTHYIGALVEVDTEGSTPTETRTHYSFGGLPVALRTHEADEVIFVFTDHLGSVTSTWNDTTNTLTLTRYFPYGGERHSSGEMPQDQRYTGQVSDATANASGGSGLLYYNARYYDPVTAQFTQPDTIVPDPATPADLNRYSYVRGNPIRYSDPSGHCVDPADCWLGEESVALSVEIPVVPDLGVISIAYWIDQTNAWGNAGDGPLPAEWDAQRDVRASIVLNFETGELTVTVNPSCNSKRTDCSGPLPIVESSTAGLPLLLAVITPVPLLKSPRNQLVEPVIAPDATSFGVGWELQDSHVWWPLNQLAPAISGDLLVYGTEGGWLLQLSGDSFSSMRIEQTVGGVSSTLYQHNEPRGWLSPLSMFGLPGTGYDVTAALRLGGVLL